MATSKREFYETNRKLIVNKDKLELNEEGELEVIEIPARWITMLNAGKLHQIKGIVGEFSLLEITAKCKELGIRKIKILDKDTNKSIGSVSSSTDREGNEGWIKISKF